MKRFSLRTITFLAIACDLGLLGKRILAPVANFITDSLRIPGGISTGFSLMFLVIAFAIVQTRGCALLMGLVQSGIAFATGSVGSMGALAPIGYLLPACCIELVFFLTTKAKWTQPEQIIWANTIASVCAAWTANFIVFRLPLLPMCLYSCVAATSGAVFGFLGAKLTARLAPIFQEKTK